ncbi:MAG: hypothetical protein M1395_09755 [Bacteroidetes bacterium]|nr:hypothetical protein [Bacteroidota bacterium]
MIRQQVNHDILHRRIPRGDIPLVVDNNGLHGLTEKSGTVVLAKGHHPISVDYFQRAGSDSLAVFMKGPGVKKALIPASQLFRPRLMTPQLRAHPTDRTFDIFGNKFFQNGKSFRADLLWRAKCEPENEVGERKSR